jgi:hypothetical protein
LKSRVVIGRSQLILVRTVIVASAGRPPSAEHLYGTPAPGDVRRPARQPGR